MKTIHARIEGLVQGVWYRGWTCKTAVDLGLTGWVRNRTDGSVEALFHGPEALVDDMVARCRAGPPAARVAAVHVRPADPSEVPQDAGFTQLGTV